MKIICAIFGHRLPLSGRYGDGLYGKVTGGYTDGINRTHFRRNRTMPKSTPSTGGHGRPIPWPLFAAIVTLLLLVSAVTSFVAKYAIDAAEACPFQVGDEVRFIVDDTAGVVTHVDRGDCAVRVVVPSTGRAVAVPYSVLESAYAIR